MGAYAMNSHQVIAELAYHLWNARGRPNGSEEDDWFDAERQLTAAAESQSADEDGGGTVEESLKDTFPASDPVASHIPDLPPSNAEDKWIAAGKMPRRDAR
jgi:hypothetical protein